MQVLSAIGLINFVRIHDEQVDTKVSQTYSSFAENQSHVRKKSCRYV